MIRTLASTACLVALLATGLVAAVGCGNASSNGRTNAQTLTFNPPAGSTLPQATVGLAYAQTFGIASGGSAPFAFTSVGVPPGLAIATVDTFTAQLTGTPTQAGLGQVVFRVTDANNFPSEESYILQVNPATPGLTISPTTLPAGRRAAFYNQFVMESGGVSPFSWNVSSGSLPPGLALGTSQAATVGISGTPTTLGTFSFTIALVDSSTPVRSGSQAYSITIN